jgi:glycosyltransferase involved in cell wall biosynthesis
MSPLVSILIPSYNAAPWLAATLESALGQSWPRCEVIVVDDGSSDASPAIARRFEPRGVRVAVQTNRGASAARNHALRLAHGEFVQFLDADDLLHREKIAQQMAALAATPQAIAAGPWGRFEHDPAEAKFVPEENWKDSSPAEWLALNFAGRGMMPPAAWLTSRTLLDRAGPWDERLTLNDDGEYFCRVILASTGVHFCPEAISYYRSNLVNSLSRKRTPAAWQSAFLSQQLSADHLLAQRKDALTLRACADLFQRLAFEMYPDCPELVRACEESAHRYGGSRLRAEGGKSFRLASRLVGWKVARRLQQLK